MGEVVVAQQLHNVLDGHAFLGRHELSAQLVVGCVQTDGHMAIALLDKPLELVLDAHRTDGDALGTPGVAIVGGEHLGCLEHIVEVVHRLALSHEYDVGELVYLRQ